MLATIRKLLMPAPPKPLPEGYKQISTMVCIPCKKEIQVRSEHQGHEVKFPTVTWKDIHDLQEAIAKKTLEKRVKELTGKK